jgi:hypothetical protein
MCACQRNGAGEEREKRAIHHCVESAKALVIMPGKCSWRESCNTRPDLAPKAFLQVHGYALAMRYTEAIGHIGKACRPLAARSLLPVAAVRTRCKCAAHGASVPGERAPARRPGSAARTAPASGRGSGEARTNDSATMDDYGRMSSDSESGLLNKSWGWTVQRMCRSSVGVGRPLGSRWIAVGNGARSDRPAVSSCQPALRGGGTARTC